MMNITDYINLRDELSRGGNWLGAARGWIQGNLPDGSIIKWGSPKTVEVSYKQLEELALCVATAAVSADRDNQCK